MNIPNNVDLHLILSSLDKCLDSYLFMALFLICICDFCTGFGVAIKDKKIKSSVTFYGMVKYGLTLLVPFTLYPIFDLINQPSIMQGIILAFLFPHAISIVENLNNLGFKLPKSFMQFFDNFQN